MFRTDCFLYYTVEFVSAQVPCAVNYAGQVLQFRKRRSTTKIANRMYGRTLLTSVLGYLSMEKYTELEEIVKT